MINGSESLDPGDEERYVTHRQLAPILRESAISVQKINYIEKRTEDIENTLKKMDTSLSILVQKDNFRLWIKRSLFAIGGWAFGMMSSDFFSQIFKHFVK